MGGMAGQMDKLTNFILIFVIKFVSAFEVTSELSQHWNPRWIRPDCPPIDPSRDKIVFQQIDLEHYIGKHNVKLVNRQ